MSDLISRADAICEVLVNDGIDNIVDRINALPSAELTLQTPQTYGKSKNPSNAEVVGDLISRADAIEAVCEECSERWKHYKECGFYKDGQCFEITALIALPSADAVPKWNCTANFVAEQLDRLRNMTDEERWDFFIKFFSPSADRPTEDYSDLPDIPRAYYEKIVGNWKY